MGTSFWTRCAARKRVLDLTKGSSALPTHWHGAQLVALADNSWAGNDLEQGKFQQHRGQLLT